MGQFSLAISKYYFCWIVSSGGVSEYFRTLFSHDVLVMSLRRKYSTTYVDIQLQVSALVGWETL